MSQQIDPSIYQYDEIYDEIKKPEKTKKIEKKEKGIKHDEKKNSRYIGNMKKIVEKREKDHQRAREKKVQRQNERNGIGEGEIFVTQSYLKKKQQQKEIQRLQKQQEEYDKKHSIENKNKTITSFTQKLLENNLRNPE